MPSSSFSVTRKTHTFISTISYKKVQLCAWYDTVLPYENSQGKTRMRCQWKFPAEILSIQKTVLNYAPGSDKNEWRSFAAIIINIFAICIETWTFSWNILRWMNKLKHILHLFTQVSSLSHFLQHVHENGNTPCLRSVRKVLESLTLCD